MKFLESELCHILDLNWGGDARVLKKQASSVTLGGTKNKRLVPSWSFDAGISASIVSDCH